MAEAIGLAASIIAVAGLAETAITFVKKTNRIAKDLKTVREQLRRAVGDVDISARAIRMAHGTLLAYCKNKDASKAIEYLDSHASSYMETRSLYIEQHVKRLQDEMYSLRHRWTALVTWKWVISLRDEIEALRNQIMFLQHALGLMLTSVILEVILQRDSKNEIEIMHLKKTIKEDERVIHKLRKEINRRHTTYQSDKETLRSSTESLLFHDEIEIVLRLARSIRIKEDVPTRARSSRSSRTREHTDIDRQSARETSQRSRSHRSLESHSLQGSYERISRATQTPRRHHSIAQSDSFRDLSGVGSLVERASSNMTSNRSTRALSEIGPSEASGSSRQNNKREVGRVPSSESVSERAVSRSSHRIQEISPSTSDEANDFMSVCARESVMKIIESPNYISVPGHVRLGDGIPQPVTAILEEEQTFNYMTNTQASQLGFLGKVQPYTEEEEAEKQIVDKDGRRIKPTGKLYVKWQTTPQSRSFSLEFEVIPYNRNGDLVLGKPFVRRRSYYKEDEEKELSERSNLL